MPKIDISALPIRTGSVYPAPYDAMMAGRSSIRVGDAGGLTQFGANIVILAPGGLASMRHWHAEEDEFAYIISGHPTLVDDSGKTAMAPGDCATFPAGVENGHHFVNETEEEVRFLIVGTKSPNERAIYSDIDMMVVREDGVNRFTTKDGTPL